MTRLHTLRQTRTVVFGAALSLSLNGCGTLMGYTVSPLDESESEFESDGGLDLITEEGLDLSLPTRGEEAIEPDESGFYVSPDGAGLHDGSTPANPMSLPEAQQLSGERADQTTQFLLLTGEYGTFSEKPAVARTAWHTWKAATGQAPLFSSIVVEDNEAPQVSSYLRFLGGDHPIELFGGGVYLQWVRHLDFDGLEIHGKVSEPFGPWEKNCERYLTIGDGLYAGTGVTDLRLANSEIYDFQIGATGKGSNTVFEGNVLRDIGVDAVHFPWGQSQDLGDQSHFIFRENEVYHVGDCFLSYDPTPHPDVLQIFLSFDWESYKVSDIQIIDNIIHDVGNAQGIFLSPGVNGLVSDVRVEGNILTGVYPPFTSYSYNQIDGLTVRHNSGGGHRFRPEVSNVIQEYNLTDSNIWYEDGAHILSFENHITNGWMDPTWQATGPTCKGVVETDEGTGAPLCTQPSADHCDVTLWTETVGALPCEP